MIWRMPEEKGRHDSRNWIFVLKYSVSLSENVMSERSWPPSSMKLHPAAESASRVARRRALQPTTQRAERRAPRAATRGWTGDSAIFAFGEDEEEEALLLLLFEDNIREGEEGPLGVGVLLIAGDALLVLCDEEEVNLGNGFLAVRLPRPSGVG